MPRPPKRELSFTVTIEGKHDTLMGRRERNQLINVLTNTVSRYLHDRHIPYSMVGIDAPSNEDIDNFQSTFSYSAPDWNAIWREEMAELEGKLIHLDRTNDGT